MSIFSVTSRKLLRKLLDDFYLCGWDLDTGIPLPEKLRELGLERLVRDLQRYSNGI